MLNLDPPESEREVAVEVVRVKNNELVSDLQQYITRRVWH